MISNRTGKEPVTTLNPLLSAMLYHSAADHASLPRSFGSSPSGKLALFSQGSRLAGLLRTIRMRRSLRAALLAGSTVAAATVSVTATVHYVRHAPVVPLAPPPPVATASEALEQGSAFAMEARRQARRAARLESVAKRHILADAFGIRYLSDLHPLRGIATWYGSVLHGHRTASGERFDETQLTAAHRTLPLGTVVRVTDLDTGRSVVVRINDRGVLAEGRVIDLSSAAAEELGILRSGTAKVKLTILPPSQS